eukprot:symbB.v1.2.002236.t1/scaffold118.1/size318305/8
MGPCWLSTPNNAVTRRRPDTVVVSVLQPRCETCQSTFQRVGFFLPFPFVSLVGFQHFSSVASFHITRAEQEENQRFDGQNSCHQCGSAASARQLNPRFRQANGRDLISAKNDSSRQAEKDF